MARIRTVKPEFFLDADLCELSPLHRLMFEGLWCYADCEGRLRDKPRELKIKILPYDDCDADQLLADLDSRGFIQRYAANGERCIFITKFPAHQKPHPKETSFCLPPPPEPGNFTASPEGMKHAGSISPAVPECELSQQGGNGNGNGNGNGSFDGDGEREPRKTAAAAPSSSLKETQAPSNLPLAVERPTKPPEAWTGDDFWQWAQWQRQENGFLVEKRLHLSKLGTWWSAALMTPGVTVDGLKQGFGRFGTNPHWEKSNPPYPFAAFMADWRNYTRPKGEALASTS